MRKFLIALLILAVVGGTAWFILLRPEVISQELLTQDFETHRQAHEDVAQYLIRHQILIGCAGFLALMSLQKDLPRLKAALQDRKGLTYVAILTLFGPALGVSLSLMALTPVLIILPYALLYKQKVRLKEILGVTVSMVGVAMFFLM